MVIKKQGRLRILDQRTTVICDVLYILICAISQLRYILALN